MFRKVICLVVMIAVIESRPQDDHGHGHAFSSQSIVHHMHHTLAHHEKRDQGNEHYEHGYNEDGQKHNEYYKKEHTFSSQNIKMHLGHHMPVHYGHYEAHKHDKREEHQEHRVDYYAHPKYEYDYKVEDHHTGDQKMHHEVHDNGVVKGFYSLREPDGRTRIVEYTADKHTGFHAVVRHEGHAHVMPEYHH